MFCNTLRVPLPMAKTQPDGVQAESPIVVESPLQPPLQSPPAHSAEETAALRAQSKGKSLRVSLSSVFARILSVNRSSCLPMSCHNAQTVVVAEEPSSVSATDSHVLSNDLPWTPSHGLPGIRRTNSTTTCRSPTDDSFRGRGTNSERSAFSLKHRGLQELRPSWRRAGTAEGEPVPLLSPYSKRLAGSSVALPLERITGLKSVLQSLSPEHPPAILHSTHRELQIASDMLMAALERELSGASNVEFFDRLQDLAATCFSLCEEFYSFVASNDQRRSLFGSALEESAPFLALKAAVGRRLFAEAKNAIVGPPPSEHKDEESWEETHAVTKRWMKVGGPQAMITTLLQCLEEQENSCLVWYVNHTSSGEPSSGEPSTDSIATFAYVLGGQGDCPVVVSNIRTKGKPHRKDSILPWFRRISNELSSLNRVTPETLKGYKVFVKSKYDRLVRPLEHFLPHPFVFNKGTLYVADTRHELPAATAGDGRQAGQAWWLAGFMDKAGFLAVEKWAIAVVPEVWTVILSSWLRHMAFFKGSLDERAAALRKEPYGACIKPLLSRNSYFCGDSADVFDERFRERLASKRAVAVSEVARVTVLANVNVAREPWRALAFSLANYGGLLQWMPDVADADPPAEEEGAQDEAKSYEKYCEEYGINGLLEGMLAEVVVARPRTEAALINRLLFYLCRHELPLRTMVAGARQTTSASPLIMLPPRSTPRKGFTPLQHVHFMQMRPVPFQRGFTDNPWEHFFHCLVQTPRPNTSDAQCWRPGPVSFWTPKRIGPLRASTESSASAGSGASGSEEGGVEKILITVQPTVPGDNNRKVELTANNTDDQTATAAGEATAEGAPAAMEAPAAAQSAALTPSPQVPTAEDGPEVKDQVESPPTAPTSCQQQLIVSHDERQTQPLTIAAEVESSDGLGANTAYDLEDLDDYDGLFSNGLWKGSILSPSISTAQLCGAVTSPALTTTPCQGTAITASQTRFERPFTQPLAAFFDCDEFLLPFLAFDTGNAATSPSGGDEGSSSSGADDPVSHSTPASRGDAPQTESLGDHGDGTVEESAAGHNTANVSEGLSGSSTHPLVGDPPQPSVATASSSKSVTTAGNSRRGSPPSDTDGGKLTSHSVESKGRSDRGKAETATDQNVTTRTGDSSLFDVISRSISHNGLDTHAEEDFTAELYSILEVSPEASPLVLPSPGCDLPPSGTSKVAKQSTHFLPTESNSAFADFFESHS